MTLPRILLDWEGGPTESREVYTDNGIGNSDLSPQDGRDAIDRTPDNVLAFITDDERDQPGRPQKLATRLRAMQRLTDLPVSQYANVATNYYSFRSFHASALARRGVDVGYENKTLAQRIREPMPDYSTFARQPVLDASRWAIVTAYAIDDAREPWMDAAVLYEGARACRQVAPRKPCVAYVSPIVFASEDMGRAIGLMDLETRWVPIIAAGLEAFDALIVWGAESYKPASEVAGYFEVAKAMAKAA
jgi:hypothetical protein